MNEPKLVHYVEFHFPLTNRNALLNLMQNAGIHEVASRDPRYVPTAPANAHALTFFDQLEATVEWEGVPVKLTSERLNRSPRYFRGGTVVTKDELLKQFPGETKTFERMLNENLTRMIKTSAGHFEPFDTDDVVLQT